MRDAARNIAAGRSIKPQVNTFVQSIRADVNAIKSRMLNGK